MKIKNKNLTASTGGKIYAQAVSSYLRQRAKDDSWSLLSSNNIEKQLKAAYAKGYRVGRKRGRKEMASIADYGFDSILRRLNKKK